MRGGQCIKSDGCLNLLSNGICTACDSAFYLLQGKCVPCDVSCQTCKDNTLCLTCKQGYYNTSNINYALCTMCPAGCKICTSGSSCSACN